MKTKNIFLNFAVLTAFVLTACGGAPTHEAMMEDEMTDTMPMTEAPMAESSDSMDEMMESPAWFGAQMTNVNTGETYSINDLKGKVVLVETMAVWCSNCRKQQEQVKALHEKLGENADLVSIGLDIDSNEDESKLRDFVQGQGFDWVYSVSPKNVSSDLASLYGNQYLNPPSTPMLIIDRHGNVHTLPFGIKSADDLLAAIQPFLDEGM